VTTVTVHRKNLFRSGVSQIKPLILTREEYLSFFSIYGTHWYRFKKAYGINESTVVVGLHRKSQPDQFTVRLSVSKVLINHKFDRPGRFLTSDIMLLKLAHPVEFNEAVAPICLPDLFRVLPSGKNCYSSGWGTLWSEYIQFYSLLLALRIFRPTASGWITTNLLIRFSFRPNYVKRST